MKAKVKIKTIVICGAITESGEALPIKGDTSELNDGDEIIGEIEEYDEQDRYENGEYARSYTTHKNFVIKK